jgi:Holliday junction resolvase-like predicted endonuclease
VNARSSGYLIEPKDAVDWQKIQKIKKTALSYASGNLERLFRFDVLEIIEGKFYRQYNLIKNAFDFDD